MNRRTCLALAAVFATGCTGIISETLDPPADDPCTTCGVVDAGAPADDDDPPPDEDTPKASRTEVGAGGVILLDGAPTLPIGLSPGPSDTGMSPRGTNGLEEVTAAGINFLRLSPKDDLTDLAAVRSRLDAFALHGAHAWVTLNNLSAAAAGSPEETRLKEVLADLAGHKALGLWKGADRPFQAGLTAASLKPAYQTAQTSDPDHLWVLIQAAQGTDDDLAPYSDATDVHGVFVYPVSYGVANPNLHAVGTWTKRMQDVTANRAVFAVLQICHDGSDSADGTAYVVPTLRQERYMIYDALVNGARGLFFFGAHYLHCMSARDKQLGWNWKFWDEVLAPLVGEIGPKSAVYPALVATDGELQVTTTDTGTQVTTRRVGEKDIWVILTRHASGTANVTVSGLPAEVTTGDVYTEARAVEVTEGAFTDSIGQWGVHVYRFAIP